MIIILLNRRFEEKAVAMILFFLLKGNRRVGKRRTPDTRENKVKEREREREGRAIFRTGEYNKYKSDKPCCRVCLGSCDRWRIHVIPKLRHDCAPLITRIQNVLSLYRENRAVNCLQRSHPWDLCKILVICLVVVAVAVDQVAIHAETA